MTKKENCQIKRLRKIRDMQWMNELKPRRTNEMRYSINNWLTWSEASNGWEQVFKCTNLKNCEASNGWEQVLKEYELN